MECVCPPPSGGKAGKDGKSSGSKAGSKEGSSSSSKSKAGRMLSGHRGSCDCVDVCIPEQEYPTTPEPEEPEDPCWYNGYYSCGPPEVCISSLIRTSFLHR